ncbi:MAG: sulfotransferase [Candidatus Aminicenantes bacterium]|nr:sulfotransferase [Candidatus Aminicenantes bacterium]
MKTVVILSMPRSGSSLLSGVLFRLGVWMGREENMKIGKHLNKFGCYENQDFIGFNEYMLFKSKRLLNQARRLNDSDGLVEKAVRDHEERIIEIIRKNERELWGFKNPTMIYTLPYFHHHLKNPYYICLKREPKSIADSLKRAAKFKNWLPEIRHEFLYFSLIEKIQIILRFIKVFLKSGFIFTHESLYEEIAKDGYKRIDDFLKDKRYLDLKLIDLLEDSEKTIWKITDFLGITPSEKQIKDALSFIRPDLIKS